MEKVRRRTIENVRENLRTLTEPFGEKQRLVYASRECYQTLNSVLKGRVDPSMNLLLSACELYEVTPEQMMKGPIPERALRKKVPSPHEKEIAHYASVYPKDYTAMHYGVSRQYVSYCVCKVRKAEERGII